MRNNLFVIILIFPVSLFYACKKQEGKGGRHHVTGQVYARKYDTSTHTYTSPLYVASEEDVYIIYGDEPSEGDHQKTIYNGTFEFKYLHKGHYKVFAYSKDSTNSTPSGKTSVIKEFTIGSEKTTTLPDIIILK